MRFPSISKRRLARFPPLLLTVVLFGHSALASGASKLDSAYAVRPYSESDISALIILPATPRELLLNLKQAVDKDWLVQSSFFSDSNLLKFFNATKVSWDQDSLPGLAPNDGSGGVAMNRLVFSHVTVELTRAILRKQGHNTVAALSGLLMITLDASSPINVGLVRDVFGIETEDKLDFGTATDGQGSTPTTGGALVYEAFLKELPGAPFREHRVAFGVRKTTPGMPIMGSRFSDDEVVDTVLIFQAER